MSCIERWFEGWIDIGCGLIAVATLGIYRPNWDMAFCAWATMRKIRPKP